MTRIPLILAVTATITIIISAFIEPASAHTLLESPPLFKLAFLQVIIAFVIVYFGMIFKQSANPQNNGSSEGEQ